MLKRIMLGGLMIVATSCGDSKDTDKNNGDASTTSGSSASGGSSSSSSSSGGSSGSNSSSTGSGDGGPGSSAGGSSSSSGGSGGSSSTPGATPADGAQLARCMGNDDCNDGLNCYVFGRYCSAECATDADCTSLGSGYTCNARATGGGGFPGGGGQMGADAAAPAANGTCRLQCDGASDTSCPSGMTCVTAGGGGQRGGGMADGGMTATGTGRCAYGAETTPMGGGDGGTMMMGGNAGTTAAFGQCSDDGDCADGLSCTAARGSSGYCTESCDMDMDCAMTPGSGSVMPTCSRGGNCTLSCAAMGAMCPTGMTCVRTGGGGGGMGTASCNFASTMAGGGAPAGSGAPGVPGGGGGRGGPGGG